MLPRGPEVYKPMNSLQWDINIAYKTCSLFIVENLDVFGAWQWWKKNAVVTVLYKDGFMFQILICAVYSFNWAGGINWPRKRGATEDQRDSPGGETPWNPA